MRLKVYAADTSALCNQELFDKLYGKVSESRRRKTDRLHFMKDKCLSLGVEFLLMCACDDFGLDYAGMEITENEFSKPGFKDCSVYFNLSHINQSLLYHKNYNKLLNLFQYKMLTAISTIVFNI